MYIKSEHDVFWNLRYLLAVRTSKKADRWHLVMSFVDNTNAPVWSKEVFDTKEDAEKVIEDLVCSIDELF